MKLDDWLAQRSQSCPDRIALIADGSEVTYAELEAEATWVARRLEAHGVRRGSTAALTMEPRREQVVLVHALMKVGAVLLPLSPRLTTAERAAVIAARTIVGRRIGRGPTVGADSGRLHGRLRRRDRPRGRRGARCGRLSPASRP